VRLPGSLTDESEAGRLQVLDEANDPSSHMARQVKWRTEAKKAFVEIDGSERLRRGILGRSRPMRDSYPVGSYVYFYRKARRQPGQNPVSGRWRSSGPATPSPKLGCGLSAGRADFEAPDGNYAKFP
jgi:hypothetical protein